MRFYGCDRVVVRNFVIPSSAKLLATSRAKTFASITNEKFTFYLSSNAIFVGVFRHLYHLGLMVRNSVKMFRHNCSKDSEEQLCLQPHTTKNTFGSGY